MSANASKFIQRTQVSRRQFLTATLAGAAGSVALAGCATAGIPKISKGFAGYKEKASGKSRCHDCVHFLSPNGCTVVSGTINENGVCNYFLPAK